MKQAKEIKKKIRSVQSIEHITRAMKMVATAKLRKAQARNDAIAPYGHRIDTLAMELTAATGGVEHPYLAPVDPGKPCLALLIGSDKGLCGSYNTNICRYFQENVSPDSLVVTVGKKAADWCGKTGHTVIARFPNRQADPDLDEVRPILEAVIGPFDEGKVGRVEIYYTRFISTIKYAVECFRLLPFELGVEKGFEALPLHGRHEFIFDPGPEVILTHLLPRVVRMKVYTRLMQAITSEHAARMTSMENATDTAADMLNELTITLNKARQESITLELLDIVGGAEALQGDTHNRIGRY